VLLGLTLRLIQRISEAYPESPIHFYIDKQGARDHYANPLLRAFEGRHLRVIHEDSETSAYELTRDASSWRVSFHQSGESKHLPVALASCMSKYLREVLMGCFNEYWAGQIPELKPTAGYYQDGLRFLNDIGERAKALGIDRERLVRSR
jgi:ribonuclease HIII